MPISAKTETLYPLGELGAHLPTKRSYHTVRRWWSVGMRRADGNGTARLETIIIGGVRHSTIEAYHRMVEAANQ